VALHRQKNTSAQTRNIKMSSRKKVLIIVLILSLPFALSACSSSDDPSSDNPMNSDTTDATPSILQGVWEVDCYLDTELPTEIDAVYRKVNVSFTGGS